MEQKYKHCNISFPCPTFSTSLLSGVKHSKPKRNTQNRTDCKSNNYDSQLDAGACARLRLNPGCNNNMDLKFCCRGVIKLLLWTILFGTLVFLLMYFSTVYHKDESHKGDFHFLLSYFAVIIITGYGSIVFEVCNCIENVVQMLLHVFIYTLALGIIVYDNISMDSNIAEVDTLHGLLGYLTITLFILVYVVGILSCSCRLFFNHTNCSLKYRCVALPGHVNFSVVMYLLAIFTAITGIVVESNKAEDDEKFVINIFGLFTILTGFIVVYKVEYSYTSEYEY